MAFEKNLNGDDLIAHISEILDKAEQFGKKRADQVGTEIGKALSDGIQEEMDDAKKDVKNSVGELMAEWQKLVRSINNNKLQMKPEKIKVVLDTAEALKDTERFGKEVRKQLSGIAATFNGVKIKGLDAVAKKFKTSSEELESIDWGFGKHHDTMIQQVTKQADAVKDVGDAAKATQAAVEELTKREISWYLLTGHTAKKERVQMAEAFNQDDTSVFCISLKAGGTGLNLTGADIVIHFDPWWNAAAETQAEDRAHRIGQKEVVTVYKLIAKNSLEEKIVQLQARKKELASQVLGGDGIQEASFSREELLELLENH